jgi:ribosomal-protein-serine acetyltransferase
MKRSKAVIRAYQESDAEQIFQAVQESHSQVSPWMPDLNSSLSVGDIRAYIAAQTQLQAESRAYNFAIIEPHSQRFMGGCGLTQIQWQHRLANLYYWVRSSATRQGAASTAALLLARFGFDTLGLLRIELVMGVSNRPSIGLAKKIGATQEGRLRNRLFLHGSSQDAYLYSLIPSDLEPAEPVST